jgi:hypothetical protein
VCRCTSSPSVSATDPATLLHHYAERTEKADANAAEAIASLSRGVLS